MPDRVKEPQLKKPVDTHSASSGQLHGNSICTHELLSLLETHFYVASREKQEPVAGVSLVTSLFKKTGVNWLVD